MMTAATRIKYPRTPHLPWSGSATEDDRVLAGVEHFEGREVVVTEKMDGENTSLYADYVHARSVDSSSGKGMAVVKRLLGERGYLIPEGWRVCGENCYARHSLAYEALPAYFLVFSIWTAENEALGWDETLEWCALLGLHPVPVLWRGLWDAEAIRRIALDTARQEGYVVRLAGAFPHVDFARSVAKYVRPHHVQTDSHWRTRPLEINRLAST